MARSPEFDFKPGELDAERTEAKRRGVDYPSAGLPDLDAIKKVFGWTLEDLSSFNPPRRGGRKISRCKQQDDL